MNAANFFDNLILKERQVDPNKRMESNSLRVDSARCSRATLDLTLTMKLFRTLTTLLVPRKAEFAKRLVAKRRASAKNALLASVATLGTTEYRLRTLGLESIEYAVTPEATIVNILEQYWQPHIANFYTNPQLFGGLYEARRGASEEERAVLARKRVNDLAGHLEYRLTGKSDAAEHLPEFNIFLEYMRYRIHVEHPNNPHLGPDDGFTDEFLTYALEESRFVFGRKV